jgi:hypothetical protein
VIELKVKKQFEGDLGNGPQTVVPGQVIPVEELKGEPKYWVDMGLVEVVKPKPRKAKVESAALEGAPETAVEPKAKPKRRGRPKKS